MKQPCVYILASRLRPDQRIWEHQQDPAEDFTKKYGVTRFVWFEQHATMHFAISREKAIKEWNRDWKIELIETENPLWRDLYSGLL